MPVDESLNKILKEMWRLDEKVSSNEELNETEKDFYDKNLSVIKEYYASNNIYWQSR